MIWKARIAPISWATRVGHSARLDGCVRKERKKREELGGEPFIYRHPDSVCARLQFSTL